MKDTRECGWLGCGHPVCEKICQDISIERVEANRALIKLEAYDEWYKT